MATPGDDAPILLSPGTYERHEAAAQYVEDVYHNRVPRSGRSRSPRAAPGAWGLLASGATISACSGVTLGAGTVKLCDRTGTAYSPDETVDVANAGGAITADDGDAIVALEWVLGEWVACGCGDGGVPFFCRGVDDATACPSFPRTLHFTDSVMGSCVLTFSGFFSVGWTGTFTYHYPGSTLACNGGNACPAKDITIYVRFYRTGVICEFNVACTFQTVIPGTTICPDDAGDILPGLTDAGGPPLTVDCSPFHVSRAYDLATRSCVAQTMYGLDSGTVTLTVTA